MFGAKSPTLIARPFPFPPGFDSNESNNPLQIDEKIRIIVVEGLLGKGMAPFGAAALRAATERRRGCTALYRRAQSPPETRPPHRRASCSLPSAPWPTAVSKAV